MFSSVVGVSEAARAAGMMIVWVVVVDFVFGVLGFVS